MSDERETSAWEHAVNWRDGERDERTRSVPIIQQSNLDRLELPFYYAANAQILISGHDASLLFTRPHPAILPDGNLAPVPRREPVALIAMSVAGLKELSQAAAQVIRQVEERNGGSQLTPTSTGEAVSDSVSRSVVGKEHDSSAEIGTDSEK
jgi:hypothetical protein